MAYKVRGSLSSYTDLEAALLVVFTGAYGNGQARRNTLGARYGAIQGIVNEIVTGVIPAGKGGGTVSKDKLEKAIDKAFSATLNDLRKEISNNYE